MEQSIFPSRHFFDRICGFCACAKSFVALSQLGFFKLVSALIYFSSCNSIRLLLRNDVLTLYACALNYMVRCRTLRCFLDSLSAFCSISTYRKQYSVMHRIGARGE